MSKYNWMPILRTGNFVDKNKQKVSITINDIDKIIEATDLSKEPQLVIEHPRFDKIGFGSISKLKRIGDYLFALPKEVNEKFRKIVNAGDLPGRSSTLDKKTFALKNISFLPPELPPAMSRLGAYSFQDSKDERKMEFILPGVESHFAEIENDKIEFAEYEASNYPFKTIQSLFRNLKNLLIEKFSKEEADEVIPEYFMDEVGNPPRIFSKPESDKTIAENPSFSKNQNGDKMFKVDVKTLDPELREAFERLQADLEKTKVELQAATETISETEKQKIRTEVLQFCESDAVKNKIKPADKEKAINFLIAQKEKGVIEFSGGGKAEKAEFDPFDYAKGLIKALPDVIEFGEIATNGNAGEKVPDYIKTAQEIAGFANR